MFGAAESTVRAPNDADLVVCSSVAVYHFWFTARGGIPLPVFFFLRSGFRLYRCLDCVFMLLMEVPDQDFLFLYSSS
jgi:hypothetical protein